jgi:hypothetical protein
MFSFAINIGGPARNFHNGATIILSAWPGLDHVDRDIDVAAYRLRVGACLVRGVCQGLGRFPLDTRQAYVEPGL